MTFLLFTAEWSKHSQELEFSIRNFLPDLDWRKSPLESEELLHKAYAIRRYPTLVKLEGDVEVARTTEMDLVEILKFTQESLNENPTGTVRDVAEAVPERPRENEEVRPGTVRLRRDLTIHAGTELVVSGNGRCLLIGAAGFGTGHFSVNLQEAKEAGLI